MKFMELSGEQMGEQKKGYVVAGTMSSMGEEVSARGKIMVFDVMEVIIRWDHVLKLSDKDCV